MNTASDRDLLIELWLELELFQGLPEEDRDWLLQTLEREVFELEVYSTIQDLIGFSEKQALNIRLCLLLIQAEQEGQIAISSKGSHIEKKLKELRDPKAKEVALELSQFDEGNYLNIQGDSYLIYKSDQLFMFHKHKKGVEFLRNKILEHMNHSRPLLDQQERWPELIENFSCYKDFELNNRQKLGLYASILHNLVLICGGPGTGKTSLLCSFLGMVLHHGYKPEEVILTAPTGRAAQRLEESILHEAQHSEVFRVYEEQLKKFKGQTLHRLLLNRKKWIEAKVLILDEFSMVHMDLMVALMKFLKPQTHLVVLGDPHQLPPVHPGSVMLDLIPDESCFSANFLKETQQWSSDLKESSKSNRLQDKVIELNQSHRFKGALNELTQKVRKGDLSAMTLLEDRRIQLKSIETKWEFFVPEGKVYWDSPDMQNRCHWLEVNDNLTWKAIDCAWEWLRESFQMVQPSSPLLNIPSEKISDIEFLKSWPELKEWFKQWNHNRILGVTKWGAFGVSTINTQIARKWSSYFEDLSSEIIPGAPVIIVRNDPKTGLYNGDTGVVLRSEEGDLKVFFDKGDRSLCLSPSFLPEWEWSWAITVHKSQGSQYERVMLLTPEKEGHALLTRKMLTTGLSRAKKNVLFVGSKKNIESAILREEARVSALW